MQTLRAILPGCCAVDAWPLELLPLVLNASSNSPQGSLASGSCWSYIRWKFTFASISSIYLVDGWVGLLSFNACASSRLASLFPSSALYIVFCAIYNRLQSRVEEDSLRLNWLDLGGFGTRERARQDNMGVVKGDRRPIIVISQINSICAVSLQINFLPELCNLLVSSSSSSDFRGRGECLG